MPRKCRRGDFCGVRCFAFRDGGRCFEHRNLDADGRRGLADIRTQRIGDVGRAHSIAGESAVFPLALPTGALADIVDKRRLLFLTQVLSLLSALALGVITIFGFMSPAILLAFAFLPALAQRFRHLLYKPRHRNLFRARSFLRRFRSQAFRSTSRAVGPALGSFLRGTIADNFGLRVSLIAAGMSIVASIFFCLSF